MKEESIDASDDRFCARSIVTRFRTRSFVRRSRPRISDGPFGSLPENCIACILSFTSPRDTCRLATLSSRFRSAAESDQVWTKFLSSDYQDVLSRIDASDPVHLSSKREIFFGLNDHILIDGGKKVNILWCCICFFVFPNLSVNLKVDLLLRFLNRALRWTKPLVKYVS